MIKELVNFTQALPEDFKNQGSQPKEGLHILLHQKNENQICSIDLVDFEYELFSKKEKGDTSAFLSKCKVLQQNAWCIDTNKCFDLPTKAIHSCSPFMVAFKREHLIGGEKYKANAGGTKKQIYERFLGYFEKSNLLIDTDSEIGKSNVFKNFFIQNQFSLILDKIEEIQCSQRLLLTGKQEELKELSKNCKDKDEKQKYKDAASVIDQQLLKVRQLTDADYIIFYLEESLENYKIAHKKYLDDKLFNTDKYNTIPNEDGLIYGTSNFLNGFNSNMPFLMHQTASFDISGRISNLEAKFLYEFKNILPNKILPSPLPVFIYQEELDDLMIKIIRENGFKLGYKEIIEKLIKDYNADASNYYLLFWQNTKDGIVFKDFDFVTKFEYKLKDEMQIENLFEIKEKGGKGLKFYPLITDVFSLEQAVLKPFIQNKYLRVDYFSDLSKDGYEGIDLTFLSYSKYRKTVYDYVYKSQRQTIDQHVFYEMVFNAIKDDIKRGNEYGIKEKLNIWYSTQHFFNQQNKEYMGSKLKDYQNFVEEVISDEGLLREANDTDFAFISGMVIDYLMSKSKSADTSYQLLEPYLQQSKCSEFKKAIANDFARYKHENYSRSFERAAAFVLSYETTINLKQLLPEILSGVFAKNQLYSKIKNQ